jgi:thiosulfate/3-mercaptopyruvate sulfurtransferase
MRHLPICFVILVFGISVLSDTNGVVHATTIYLEKTPPQPPKKPKSSGPILLDARPAFDYAMGHLPKAQSIRWQDYSQTQDPHKGALDPDYGLLSRKLRFLGVSPEKAVVVLGSGEKGQGEEGRIAWMLTYLGVKKVRTQNISQTPGMKTTEGAAENESAPPWNPIIRSSLRVRKSDVEKIEKETPEGKTLIDVREATEFSKKHIDGAVNIPWPLFLNDKGEGKSPGEVKELLIANHVDASKPLICYSQDGVASGYVAFILYSANLDAANYDGAFNEWIN